MGPYHLFISAFLRTNKNKKGYYGHSIKTIVVIEGSDNHSIKIIVVIGGSDYHSIKKIVVIGGSDKSFPIKEQNFADVADKPTVGEVNYYLKYI